MKKDPTTVKYTVCILLALMALCCFPTVFWDDAAGWIFALAGIGFGIAAVIVARGYRCPHCGGRLSVRNKLRHCPHCGARLEDDFQ